MFRWGHCPLWHACAHRHVPVVLLLLSKGKARPWVTPQSSVDEECFPRPLVVADQRGFYACSDLLQVSTMGTIRPTIRGRRKAGHPMLWWGVTRGAVYVMYGC